MVKTTKLTEAEMDAIVQEMAEAATEAWDQAKPAAMVVQRHANMLDDTSEVVEQWVVNEGVCGFSYVNLRNGGSRFARYLKRKGIARTDSYYGGVTFAEYNVTGLDRHRYSQSYERKCAASRAMIEVLNKHGFTAYADSRLD